MSTAKDLLEQATPLPWPEDYGQAIGDDINDPDDAALAVYAVNRLPDYEAAVDALEYIERRLRPMDPPHHDGQEGRRWADVNDAYTMAVGALALLRDEVPA